MYAKIYLSLNWLPRTTVRLKGVARFNAITASNDDMKCLCEESSTTKLDIP
jgi:hypothetical protein